MRAFVYVYTAVRMALGKMTSPILPCADTAMMSLTSAQVVEAFNDYFVIMLVDQAGWHRAKIDYFVLRNRPFHHFR